MSADYPSAVFTAMTRGALMSDATTQGDFVDKLQDELHAVESTLGVNPQGASATVAARLAAITFTAGTVTITASVSGLASTLRKLTIAGVNVVLFGLTAAKTTSAGTAGATIGSIPAGYAPTVGLSIPGANSTTVADPKALVVGSDGSLKLGTASGSWAVGDGMSWTGIWAASS